MDFVFLVSLVIRNIAHFDLLQMDKNMQCLSHVQVRNYKTFSTSKLVF